MQQALTVSERRACRVLKQPRSTQRRTLVARGAEDVVTTAIADLASEYDRYGYRRITALLRHQGWHVNHKRVERIWRREGLKVPQKQPKRGRLWLNDGSCVRRRPKHRHHAWSYDFVMDRTHDGRALRMLTVIDEYSRKCLAIRTEHRQNQETVLETLADLILLHGPPVHVRSENGTEFTATAVRQWPHRLDLQTLFIDPRCPWGNGYNESFDGKLRDELLNGEIFYTLKEARILVEKWRDHYNTSRPHRSLGYRPPAPQAINPLVMPASATQQ